MAVTLGFLLAFLGVRGGVGRRERGGRGWAPLIGLGLLLLTLWFLVGVRPPGIVEPNALIRQLAYGSALGVAVFGLVLVEQCYRRTPPASRWHVRPLMLGFAGLFAFDVVLYSDALLFRALDFDLWSARGFAQALTVPLMLVTLRRRADWSFDLSVSRGVVAGSTALLLTGVYLLLMAGAGFLLRQFGGSWGRALESALVFAALLLLAAVGLSATFRAKVRVLVAKHFFTYRYDYREEWLRFTNTLTSGDGGAALVGLHPGPRETWSRARAARCGFETGDRAIGRSSGLSFPADPDALAETTRCRASCEDRLGARHRRCHAAAGELREPGAAAPDWRTRAKRG